MSSRDRVKKPRRKPPNPPPESTVVGVQALACASPKQPKGWTPTAPPELYQILVDCRDEADQQAVYERLTAEGYTCRVLTI